MKRLPLAVLLAAAALAPVLANAQATGPAPATEPASPHSFTGKVGVYTEYEYRGISQTDEKPALQLNLDYAHASGFYVGTFVSNIEWLKKTAQAGGFSTSANIEWDIYGGWKKEVAKDLTLDVGYLRYEYPRSGAFAVSPNTDEIYAGLTYGPFNVKYSHSIGDETFGIANSKNSYFLEGNLAWPIDAVKGLSITGHIGHQEFKNNDFFSYTVWKVGALYDFGNGLNVGAYFKGTDAETNAYVLTPGARDWAKDRLVAFVTYSF